MTGVSTLNYVEIDAKAELLKTASNNIATELNVVKSELDKIGSEEVWSGNSANETREEVQVLIEKFPMFSEKIDDCYAFLKKAAAGYAQLDARK